MKFGISIPPFGDYADPRHLAQMAHEAEEAGWDGFFLWDHVIFDPTFHPIANPWVALAAVAMRTIRLRIGTLVTPLARRRPWQVARETVTLDHLSGGRLALGVGLGDPVQWDYGFLGEEQDARVRAKKLDESLDILKGLWTAQPFHYDGEHYHLTEMVLRPALVQSPRIPIWVGGNLGKRKPLERAARWDGYHPLKWGSMVTPDEWRALLVDIHVLRGSGGPFDAVHGGTTPGDNPQQAADIVRPYIDAGVTWWVESVDPWRWGRKWEEPLTPEDTRRMDERIRQGPPRV
jgi:alkanesulfonate monooxygenase SsuD/methylene tetrahydromethanopterin reductase-like flavin-dependent oxidoreductase (luciferase family)